MVAVKKLGFFALVFVGLSILPEQANAFCGRFFGCGPVRSVGFCATGHCGVKVRSFCGTGSCASHHFSHFSHYNPYRFGGFYGLNALAVERLKFLSLFFQAAAGRIGHATPHLNRIYKADGKWYEELSNGIVNWLAPDSFSGRDFTFANEAHKRGFCTEAWDWYTDWKRSPTRLRKPPKKVRVFLDNEWHWCGFAQAPVWADPAPHADDIGGETVVHTSGPIRGSRRFRSRPSVSVDTFVSTQPIMSSG